MHLKNGAFALDLSMYYEDDGYSVTRHHLNRPIVVTLIYNHLRSCSMKNCLFYQECSITIIPGHY